MIDPTRKGAWKVASSCIAAGCSLAAAVVLLPWWIAALERQACVDLNGTLVPETHLCSGVNGFVPLMLRSVSLKGWLIVALPPWAGSMATYWVMASLLAMVHRKLVRRP